MNEKIKYVVLIWLLLAGLSIAAAVDPARVDLDGNLTIDIADLLIFSPAWLTHGGPSDDWKPICDISNPPDGVIDMLDLETLIDDWLVVIPDPNEYDNPADINSDRLIDVNDLQIFFAAWLSDANSLVNWNPACDIADPPDGVINLLDFAVMSAAWQVIVPDPNEYLDVPDLDDDGMVNYADYAILSTGWLSNDEPMENWNWHCDVTDPNDGFVDGRDFLPFSKYWQFNLPDPELFAFVPGGEFEMGDHTNSLHASSRPVHTVQLDSCYMSRYEVTYQQYAEFLNTAIQAGDIKVDIYNEDYTAAFMIDDSDNDYPLVRIYNATYDQNSQFDYADGVFTVRIKDGTVDMNSHPVLLSWYGAAAYCNWLSVQDNRTPSYDPLTWTCDHNAGGYRLPTEAEWEYAARGGLSGKSYPWGDTIDGTMANYDKSGDPFEDPDKIVPYPYSTPVGYYNGNQTPAGDDMANGYGLYDMAGNAFEWCQDWYGSGYYNECDNLGVVVNPIGPETGTLRVVRGGSWNTEAKHSNVAFRDDERQPQLFSGSHGFRICLPAP